MMKSMLEEPNWLRVNGRCLKTVSKLIFETVALSEPV